MQALGSEKVIWASVHTKRIKTTFWDYFFFHTNSLHKVVDLLTFWPPARPRPKRGICSLQKVLRACCAHAGTEAMWCQCRPSTSWQLECTADSGFSLSSSNFFCGTSWWFLCASPETTQSKISHESSKHWKPLSKNNHLWFFRHALNTMSSSSLAASPNASGSTCNSHAPSLEPRAPSAAGSKSFCTKDPRFRLLAPINFVSTSCGCPNWTPLQPFTRLGPLPFAGVAGEEGFRFFFFVGVVGSAVGGGCDPLGASSAADGFDVAVEAGLAPPGAAFAAGAGLAPDPLTPGADFAAEAEPPAGLAPDPLTPGAGSENALCFRGTSSCNPIRMKIVCHRGSSRCCNQSWAISFRKHRMNRNMIYAPKRGGG